MHILVHSMVLRNACFCTVLRPGIGADSIRACTLARDMSGDGVWWPCLPAVLCYAKTAYWA